MSVEGQVAKLESLLERIQQNRHPRPPVGEAPSAFAREEAATGEVPVRAPQPTPMEQALKVELEHRDEPEVEITVDADEPEITIEADAPEAPTAPVGTRAPAVTPQPAPSSPAATPQPAPRAPVAARAESPGAPEAVPLTKPKAPSGPVARVAATAKPRTFGEMIARTLALRPR